MVFIRGGRLYATPLTLKSAARTAKLAADRTNVIESPTLAGWRNW